MKCMHVHRVMAQWMTSHTDRTSLTIDRSDFFPIFNPVFSNYGQISIQMALSSFLNSVDRESAAIFIPKFPWLIAQNSKLHALEIVYCPNVLDMKESHFFLQFQGSDAYFHKLHSKGVGIQVQHTEMLTKDDGICGYESINTTVTSQCRVLHCW